MASASKIAEEAERETITLSLTNREAQLILAMFSHTNDCDSDFPEVQAIWTALKEVAPDYYGAVKVVDNLNNLRVTVRFRNV
jgi:hypothetical protein